MDKNAAVWILIIYTDVCNVYNTETWIQYRHDHNLALLSSSFSKHSILWKFQLFYEKSVT